MELTRKQQEGLNIAVARFNEHEAWTCISGYAGTGKSTLVKFIIAALNVDPDDVCYIAFTGKAATVLQQKGCPNAVTAHKLLYRSKQMPNGKYIHVPREILEEDYKIIVVDEVSMLPKDMWDLLLKHKVYVLALGDPAQLPPVDKTQDNGVLAKPHVFLDEVMRQAQDSEIIRLSMHVREGRPLSTFKHEGAQVKIFNQNQLVTGMYDWADQILCATNNKRNEINNAIRKMKGYGEEPQEGDKLISLTNHWEFFSSSGEWPLTNGQIGTLGYHYVESHNIPRYITDQPIEYMYADLKIDDDKFIMIPIDYKYLTTGETALSSRQSYQLAKNKNCPLEPPYDFAYGYAITTHKAQGSEWEKVLVFEERFPFDAEEHRRWLYTACTRASEKLVIITK